ncbi:hypothetical protein [Mycolicibacterium palauense]|uniref:hypothetical protein n=1 Tax=Mycolicibacterium palauense TaxID=2034511 RepID=UPI00159BDF9F|nr:hypothetical protein [Mycolicibacterium palauense]
MVFIGSEAVAAGRVTKYDLRARCQRVLPDVYAPGDAPLTLVDRTRAAWLWSGRRAVITGSAASALHGAKWIDDDIAIEVNGHDRKPPPGVQVRCETLFADEIGMRGGLPVTTVERTAFDLARRGTVHGAVERLDALAAATRFHRDDVLAVSVDHPHVRGIRRLARTLDMVDAGAQSPRETWLRLLLVAAGFPRPRTQIPVPWPDGHPRYYLDMGWPEVMVAVEYDGEQHRVDREIYREDLTRSEYIAYQGWNRIRVIAGDSRAAIVARVERAWQHASVRYSERKTG